MPREAAATDAAFCQDEPSGPHLCLLRNSAGQLTVAWVAGSTALPGDDVMKAVFDPIDRLLLLKPWWRKLLVMLPVVVGVVLIYEGLHHLPGTWKLLSPAFMVSFAALMYWRGKIVWRRNDGSA